MTIRHTVVFRLIHPAGSAEEKEFLTTGGEVLSAIPGLHDFRILRQVSAKSDFDFQFAMVFVDQAAYDAYNSHPAHVDFVQSRWIPEVAAFQELDFTEL